MTNKELAKEVHRQRFEMMVRNHIPMCYDEKLGFDDFGKKCIELLEEERSIFDDQLFLMQKELEKFDKRTQRDWKKRIDKEL